MRATACLLVTVLAVALASCGGDSEPRPPADTLRIATGSEGGVYAAYGDGLAATVNAHLPGLHAVVLHTDASVANLRLLERDRAEIAFSQADTAAAALSGGGRFSRPIAIAALARIYDDYVQVVVRADRGARGLAGLGDLAGKRVSIGAPGSGTAVIAERVLALSNLRGSRAPERVSLNIADSAKALAGGDIDAFFWSGGLPTAAIAELQKTVPIRLVDLRGIAVRMRARHGDLYTETRVPRSAYGAAGAVTTVSVPNLLVVRSDMDADSAYRVTRLLFERHAELRSAHAEAERLNRRAAIATYPLALHPGAARYYREAGG